MKLLSLVLLTVSVNAFSNTYESTYQCLSDKSLISVVFEGVRNTTRINGRRGYYTSAFRLMLKKIENNNYKFSFIGNKAFCEKGEQCPGPYLITSGEVLLNLEGEYLASHPNDLVNIKINLNTGRCIARSLDFRIKKSISKFKGSLL